MTTDILNFFLGGGDLCLLQDDDSHDALGVHSGCSFLQQSQPPPEEVPEPATIALVGAGLAMAARKRLRRKPNH